ncbi:MAG: hypothetical protein QY318_02095 [Candidatus Dojkabacteria bacterium]|nr:MAG: hypothetical protein QY318_02095 [Candidatus Dojkabacteria bacterium]
MALTKKDLQLIDALMEKRFTTQDLKFASIDARFDELEERFDKLETAFADFKVNFGSLQDLVMQIHSYVMAELPLTQAQVDGNSARLDKVEKHLFK